MKGEDRIKRYPYMHTSMWAGFEELREKHPKFLQEYYQLKNSRYADGRLPEKLSFDHVAGLLGEVTHENVAELFKKYGIGERSLRNFTKKSSTATLKRNDLSGDSVGNGGCKVVVDSYTWSYRVKNDEAEIVAEKDGKCSCAVSPKPTGNLVIPSTLGGTKVAAIGQNAFFFCNGLTSVTMRGEKPDSGDKVFVKCDKLKSIHVPANCKSWAGMKEWQGIPLVFDAK